MDIVKIAAIGVIAGILALTLRKSNPEIALQLSLAAGGVILLMLMGYIGRAAEFLEELNRGLGENGKAVEKVMKIVAIAYIAELSASSIKDAGESAIAGKVELAGKIIIAVMTLPVLKQFGDMLLGLLES